MLKYTKMHIFGLVLFYVLSLSLKFVFKGLAVGSLRYNVFLVSKKDWVTMSNAPVLSSYLSTTAIIYAKTK